MKSKAFSKAGREIETMLELLDAGARMTGRTEPFPSGYFSPADIVLHRGCEMRIATSFDESMLGEMKQCYYNAQRLATFAYFRSPKKPHLRYAEGWAIYGSYRTGDGAQSGLPVLHAWLVNRKGHVVDPTWGPKIPGRAYYGIIIDTDYMLKRQLQTEMYGPMIDDWEHGHKLLATKGLVGKVTTLCRRGR